VIIRARNGYGIRSLNVMQKIKTQLTAEIKQLEADIDAQKRVIRHNTRGLALEDAERNLRQLRTRLTVLETNLRKCEPRPQGGIA